LIPDLLQIARGSEKFSGRGIRMPGILAKDARVQKGSEVIRGDVMWQFCKIAGEAV
jgi:hypothetical protein